MHEYGGGMYAAFHNELGGESVVFSDQTDQRLYRQDLEAAGEGEVRRAADREELREALDEAEEDGFKDGHAFEGLKKIGSRYDLPGPDTLRNSNHRTCS